MTYSCTTKISCFFIYSVINSTYKLLNVCQMFDPLDLYTAEPPTVDDSLVITDHSVAGTDCDKQFANDVEEDEDYIVDILDLPPCSLAPPQVILIVLILLRPREQLNFANKDDNKEDIPLELDNNDEPMLNDLVQWYTINWPHEKLNTKDKLLRNIPRTTSIVSHESLLKFYTSVLQYYSKAEATKDSNEYVKRILKEVSLRIAENCGRTAQPAIQRKFRIKNLDKTIMLHEPSLTADNLGWKTWGSSLILGEIVVSYLENLSSTFESNRKVRTLELGAGTGLVGIAWAAKWRDKFCNSKTEIYLTDLPEIVDNLKDNVKINNLQDIATADVLDWTNPDTFTEKYGNERFDYIVIADPIYSPQHPEWVVNMIVKFLEVNGICHLEIPLRERYSKERDYLWRLLEEHNLDVVHEIYSSGKDDWGKVDYVYKMLKFKA